MLCLKDIHKQYKTGNLVQKALDGVSLNLRDNEFVSILGPSGSGKTTLLNIIGGLDRYDSGDLIINGISTKDYKDRDWDSYRNHTIGFVFQSYNLIPHQSVLSNVELALTIGGISRSERRNRAKKALEEVGLGNQIHKKPNQMSGGQMQRVAIARALVNNPDIVLADEPTGALDSETSVQVMELLKEVAKDRLVVMVTHNPELAQSYATRIVNLKDGHILSDTDPFLVDEEATEKAVHKNMGKSSMSLWTALSLSFNNLRTKKARTLLTSFAGSIGIIGIALILSISTGVNAYIQSIEEDTLSEYPLEISSTGVDLASMMVGAADTGESGDSGEIAVTEMVTNVFSRMDSNDLGSLKSYLESGESDIEEYVNAIEYSYNVSPQIYRIEEDGIRQINPDQTFSALGFGSGMSANSLMSMAMSTDVFFEMPANESLYEEQYEIKAGRWPKTYDECVLVLTSRGNISDFVLYALGLRDADELDEMVKQFMAEENVTAPEHMGAYSYDDVLGLEFRLVHSADYYEYDEEYEVWKDKTDDKTYMKKLVENGEPLKIVGVVQPLEDATARMLSSGIGYTAALTAHIIDYAADSGIVQEQQKKKRANVFTGENFGETSEESQFDMASLFEIDEDAISEAFDLENALSFDTSMFTIDMGDLGSINFSMPDMSQYLNGMGDPKNPGAGMEIDISGLDLSGLMDSEDFSEAMQAMPAPDFGELLGQMDFSVSAEAVEGLAADLMQGYQESVADRPEADYSRIGESFMSYLSSQEVRQKLTADIQELIQSNMQVSVSYEQLFGAAMRILNGYQAYMEENGIEEAGVDSLLAYVSSSAVQQQIVSEAEAIIRDSVTIQISAEQIQTLLRTDLVDGYQAYAALNQLPDPAKFGDYFVEYLQSEAGRARLSAGLGSILDMDSLEKQFAEVMQNYMQSMMSVYAEAMGQVLQQQMTVIMQEVAKQISAGMETTVSQMTSQITESINSAMYQVMSQVMGQVSASISRAMRQAMSQLTTDLEDAFDISPETFMEAVELNMDEDELTELLMSMMSFEDATYDSNLTKLGYVDKEQPGQIAIYPKDFESKSKVLEILDSYNERMQESGEEEKVVTYTDMVGTLMSSVTEIVDIISYVLVAFVSISLVVSSIMIGVITYISVLERKKEIGILRAIGASKRNISQVFNAETIIIGLCAGLIGIGLTLLALIPGNALIHYLADTTAINAALPAAAAAILVVLSVGLTVLGGLIPSSKAAKSDPVTALRSE